MTEQDAHQSNQNTGSSTLLGVSRWFRFDWNFAISVSRLTSFASIATILSISAFVLNEDNLSSFGPRGQIALLTAIGFYLVAFFLIKTFAPRFLQEYQVYKTYEDQKHSHRWIVWSFLNNFETLKGGARIAEETITKGLSRKPEELFVEGFANLPDAATREKFFAKKGRQKTTRVEGVGDIVATLYPPEIYKRDIYLGIEIHRGAREAPGKYILSAREADDELDQKVKELFWVIISEAAKHQRAPRIMAWVSLYAAALSTALFIFSVLFSAVTAAYSEEEKKEDKACICKCEITQSAAQLLACVDSILPPPESLDDPGAPAEEVQD